MSKIKRNDPCPCGSGQKYKHCHEPIDRAADDHRRLLRRAQDGLMTKIIEAAQSPELMPYVVPALDSFWNGLYGFEHMTELDDLEDRGAERFLTWFAFDAPADEAGRTMVERVAADPAAFELTEYEAELVPGWVGTRLRPYEVLEVRPGKGALLRDMDTGQEYQLHDHAAAKRVDEQEFLITHLVPVAEEYFIAGAAAHISDDTREQLEEYLALQKETWQLQHGANDEAAFIRGQGAPLNHFVIALPREEKVSKLDDLLMKGRVGLDLARQNIKAALGSSSTALEVDAAPDDAEPDSSADAAPAPTQPASAESMADAAPEGSSDPTE